MPNMYECKKVISGGGGIPTELLWTNNAPTSTFSAQDVVLSFDTTKYTHLLITTRRSVDSAYYKDNIMDYRSTSQEGAGNVSGIVGISDSTTYNRSILRIVKITSVTNNSITLNFGLALAYNNTTPGNATGIPYKIYAVDLSGMVL